MRRISLLIVLSSITTIFAQDAQTIQSEINKQLWKPFKTAFETLDAQKLNALYADEVLRVTPKGIDTQNSFKEKNVSRFKANKSTGTSIQLNFWFDSRHTNVDTSYEVGFYKMELTTADETNIIYGQFHIVLRKIEGTWRIAQDWDTTTINGNLITAADFEKQEPLKFD